ncbi:hypothetical protein BBJ28_00002135 [Nothophytophthora sp. Chile5]|nr:hypothetical protein BBJ28_00002135 [Nothophytophthora sp. Chile5]
MQAPPSSGGFSSAPVAPVVTSSHGRRRESDVSWLKATSGSASAGGDPAKSGERSPRHAGYGNGNSNGAQSDGSGTADEDIRAAHGKPPVPASEAGKQSNSSPKDGDEDVGLSEDDEPLARSRTQQRPRHLQQQKSSSSSLGGAGEATSSVGAPLPTLSGTAALLQLRERHRNSPTPNSTNQKSSSSSISGARGGDAYATPATATSGSSNGSNGTDRAPTVATPNQSVLPPPASANVNPNKPLLSSFGGSRSHSRERGEPNPLLPQDDDMGEEDEEDEEDDDDVDDDSGSPPPPNDRDVRIMFHGREVFADDLIGLRVAKTFAGHGRFLGQVVKFDDASSLYTVVYADGDAEDLTIDNTLQILIQDEIERADPSQLPPAVSLLFKKAEADASPASPDTGDFMTQPPPPVPKQPRRSSQQPEAGAPGNRRPQIQISDREAQFVIGLFENHALPSLVRQGWVVQTSSSGRGETRFVSSTGETFRSALDVVEFIASDNELLTACFPANVHSAILSLLPPEVVTAPAAFVDTSSNHGSTGSGGSGNGRKRTTSDSPKDEQFDGKRTRQMRDEEYRGAVPMRGAPARSGDAAGMIDSPYRADELERHDRGQEEANQIPPSRNDVQYRADELEPHARGREAADRIPAMSSERFDSGGEQPPRTAMGYRRAPGRHPLTEGTFPSRWPGDRSNPEAPGYRRRYADSSAWRERDASYVSDSPLGEAHPRNHVRANGRYPADRSLLRVNARGATEAGGAAMAAAEGTPSGYRYRDVRDSPGGQQSPMTDGFGYQQYPVRTRHGDPQSSRREMAAADYRMNEMASGRVPREVGSFMAPHSAHSANAAFSMMDVDRDSKPRSANGRMEPQPRSQSPRHTEAHQMYMQQQHRRSASGHSYHSQRSSEGHYAEPRNGASTEPHSGAVGGAGSAPSQQQD